MRRLLSFFVFSILMLLGVAACAQKPDLEVGDLNQPELKWGQQPIGFEIFSSVDYPKFAVATIDLHFEGTYLNPKRRWKYNFIIPPMDRATARLTLDIPVNFGLAQIDVTVYDVVDTLDPVAWGTKVMTQNFQIRFKIPDALTPYLQERITFPPMVENNPLLDNEFTRVLLTMLAEGKTIPEIAQMAKVDSNFVERSISDLASRKYILRRDKVATLMFPFLNTRQAEQIKPIADQMSDKLIALVKQNMPQYKRVLDSLIAAGTVSKDSSDFLNGGTVLYKMYPVVGALLLWNDWGVKFVTDTAMLDIFQGTDPCNAYLPDYMYGVQGGDFFNGHHYIQASDLTGHIVVQFGDSIPKVTCPDLYPYPTMMEMGRDWNYEPNYQYEIFVIDTALTAPVMRAMDPGFAPILTASRDELKKSLDAIKPNLMTTGMRFWFWNLVASRTLDKLVSTGTLQRRNNGQYRLESYK